MKKLTIVRHGQYESTFYSLSEIGEVQIKLLATELEKRINNIGSILVISSPLKRAKQSAEIIAKKFGILHQLETDDALIYDIDDALKLILSREQNADALIVVSHMEITDDLPRQIGIEKNFLVICPGLKKGEAVIIDCENQTFEHIQQSF